MRKSMQPYFVRKKMRPVKTENKLQKKDRNSTKVKNLKKSIDFLKQIISKFQTNHSF